MNRRKLLCLGLCLICISCTQGGKAVKDQSPLFVDRQNPVEEASVLSDEPSQIWTMQAGLLRAQLERWALDAGYQVVWKVSHDYHLQSSTTFQGTLIYALNQLFTGLQQRGNSLRVIVYRGNKVILVTEE